MPKFKNPFARKSLDSILAGFAKTIDQLEEFVVDSMPRIAEKGEQIDKLLAERRDLERDAKAAGVAAEKLRKLTGIEAL